MKVDSIFNKNADMIARIELERRKAGIGIFSIVVYKFDHEKKPCPVVLLSIDINT